MGTLGTFGEKRAPSGLDVTNTEPRVSCRSCRHLWTARYCTNHKGAGLTTRELADDFLSLPQHCPGFNRAMQEQRSEPQDRAKTDLKTEPRPTNHPAIEPPTVTLEQETIMILTETTGGAAFTPCPAGSYLARCIQLIDLGTQTTDYQGETKLAKKVLIAFEILDDETRRDDGQPFVIRKRYTASLHEKAALRKDLASWRGRDFTPDELRGFDLATVLGKNCFISVVDSTKDGKTYSNLASVMKPPKGMTAPEGTCNEPLLHWDMSAPDWEVFSQLSSKLMEQIEASPEFMALKKPTKPVAIPAPATRAPAKAPEREAEPALAGSGFDDMDSDIPF